MFGVNFKQFFLVTIYNDGIMHVLIMLRKGDITVSLADDKMLWFDLKSQNKDID